MRITDSGQKLVSILALSGPKGCGKDTAAGHLIARNSFHNRQLFVRRGFADSVRAVVKEVLGYTEQELIYPSLKETPIERWPFQAPRQPQQDIANMMREVYGGDVWAKRMARYYWSLNPREVGCLIIPDHRFPEEAAWFDSFPPGVVTRAYVYRPEAEERLEAQRAAGDHLASNVSESHYTFLTKKADFIIANRNSLDGLYRDTAAMVKPRLDWESWVPNLEPISITRP